MRGYVAFHLRQDAARRFQSQIDRRCTEGVWPSQQSGLDGALVTANWSCSASHRKPEMCIPDNDHLANPLPALTP